MSIYSLVMYEQPGAIVCYTPPRVSNTLFGGPVHGVEYYVYRCAATKDHPFAHWKYYPATMGTDELPDIRGARPLYTWSSITGCYSAVDTINVKY
jgi:hypothetical protein